MTDSTQNSLAIAPSAHNQGMREGVGGAERVKGETAAAAGNSGGEGQRGWGWRWCDGPVNHLPLPDYYGVVLEGKTYRENPPPCKVLIVHLAAHG